MPFTLSHVAAVLPLSGRRFGRWLSPTGLVVGAMVPDVALFVPVIPYAWTHAFWGVLTLDLGLGLITVALWRRVLRPPAYDLLPELDRSDGRPPPPAPTSGPAEFVRLALSLVVGGLTHVVWDAFTHQGRWGTLLVPGLQAVGPLGLPGYRLAQFASGALGLIVLVGWGIRWWRRTNQRTHGRPLMPRALVATALLATAGVTAVSVALVTKSTLDVLVFRTVTRSAVALALGVLAIAALWWILRRRAGRPRADQRR